MKSINLLIFKNKWFNILLLFVLLQMTVMGTDKGPPPTKSLAWQMEELMNWLIKTRNLVPDKETSGTPFYVIDSLDLSGSVDKNRFTFHMKGHVISKQPVLVPLFGPPDGVMLKNVTLNGQPAVVGFEDKNFYFVRTKETNFAVTGDISFLEQLGFTVPGPVNLFSADFSDGRVVEGNFLPGVKQATLHLKSGGKDQNIETDVKPLFQIARAVRIQKEVTFEYGVTVRSGKEISQVVIPMTFGEIVLEVPGVKGWKMENKNLVVPASGRSVSFTVTGRLPEAAVFKTDDRSSYEWWLIESDVEHRVTVDTPGKPVDASKSPLKRKLSSSRLFLLSRGQELAVRVNPLKALDAFAVGIASQFRKIIWTKGGEVVAEDRVSYNNNGLDYIPFDCKAKPLYFEVDGAAKTILSEESVPESQILVPLKKGRHSFRVQSIFKAAPSFFGGFLQVPTASHDLMVSRSSVRLGVPSGIFPLWLSGGERLKPLLDPKDFLFIGLSLLFALVLFKGVRVRIAGFVSFAGFYILFPGVSLFLAAAAFVGFLFVLTKRTQKGSKRWAVFVILCLGVVGVYLLSISYFKYAKYYHSIFSPVAAGIAYMGEPFDLPEDEKFEMRYGTPDRFDDFESQREDEKAGTEENVIRGVIPVPLALPGYVRSITVTKELVTAKKPLTPSLFYITTVTVIPLVLCWLLCWGYVGFYHRGKIIKGMESIRKSLNKT